MLEMKTGSRGDIHKSDFRPFLIRTGLKWSNDPSAQEEKKGEGASHDHSIRAHTFAPALARLSAG